MSQYQLNGATAQMLQTLGFLDVDKWLSQYKLLAQRKWMAYYIMSEAVNAVPTHEVPTVNGMMVLLTDAPVTMWEAVQEWRECDDEVRAWCNRRILEGVNLIANDGRLRFIDEWARHLVLYAIHNSNVTTEAVKLHTMREYLTSLTGDELPILQD